MFKWVCFCLLVLGVCRLILILISIFCCDSFNYMLYDKRFRIYFCIKIFFLIGGVCLGILILVFLIYVFYKNIKCKNELFIIL